MLARSPFCLLLVAVALLLAVDLRAADPHLPGDEQVRALLRQRIDTERRGVGIAVGLIEEGGCRTVSYGATAKEGGTAVDDHTIFEIGSVTKTFTDLLPDDMVRKGEVRLDDPVAKYLPAGVKVPSRGDRQITLLDLATHRSALPRMPDNFHPADPANPAADYTAEQLYAFLSGYALTRDIGSKMEYSNVGVGLLGHALALHAGMSYGDLVSERICRPLGMTDTQIALSPAMRERLAKPYDQTLMPAKNWDLPTLAGAGALRSDVADLLKYVAAELVGSSDASVAAAMRDTQAARNGTNSPQQDIGLGWFIDRTYDPPVWWHNGGTGGYCSFVGFCPATRTGVVVLVNAAVDLTDLGLHLLDRRYPLTPPSQVRVAVPIEPEIADRYAGRYQLAPDFILTFSCEGDRYFLAATGQPRDEVFPESETDFFSRSFDGQVTFVQDADGKWNALVLHQGGVPDQTAKRLP